MVATNPVVFIVDWLSERKFVNCILVIFYSLAILFLHDPAVKITLQVKDKLTLPVFNNVITVISFIFLILFSAVLVNRLLKFNKSFFLKFFFLFATAFYMILHSRIMFEMNIEIIHSFEYSFLAFLLFPLFKRFGAAVIFALPVMFTDEWFQYQVIYKGFVQYFELNDIVMDVFGCGFMLIAMWIFGIENEKNQRTFFKRPEYIFLAVFVLVFAISAATCFISLYEATKCTETWLVMNQLENPHSFWQTHPYHGSVYHVMEPVEGMIAITVSCLFFASLDFIKK